MTQDREIIIRMTKREAALIEKAAQMVNLTPEQYILQAAIRKASVSDPRGTIDLTKKELAAIRKAAGIVDVKPWQHILQTAIRKAALSRSKRHYSVLTRSHPKKLSS